MTAPSRYAPLFEPIDIGPKRMRNRFMQVPQCNGGGTVRPGLQAAHRAVKAEGGWAAIFTEGCSVSLEADATPYVLATLVDDDDVRNLARMCDEIHAHGSLAGVELKYASMNALESRSRARAATVFPRSFPLQVYPRHLDLDDIAAGARGGLRPDLRLRRPLRGRSQGEVVDLCLRWRRPGSAIRSPDRARPRRGRVCRYPRPRTATAV